MLNLSTIMLGNFFFASILNTFAIITVNEIITLYITLYIKLKICEPISLKMVNFNFGPNLWLAELDSWNKVHKFQFAA